MDRIQGMCNVADEFNRANLGYNQDRRTTGYNPETKTINEGKATDCSQLCTWIPHKAGYNIKDPKTVYTGNMIERFRASGEFDILPFGSVGLKGLKKGDFVHRDGHVEFFNGSKFFSAHFDENGKTRGGRDGNQTGKEVCYSAPYGTWTNVIRPRPDGVGQTAGAAKPPAGGACISAYTGSSTSIVDALKAVGVDGSKANRTKLAAANGIKGYTGTAEQNGTLLRLLKSGRLKR